MTTTHFCYYYFLLPPKAHTDPGLLCDILDIHYISYIDIFIQVCNKLIASIFVVDHRITHALLQACVILTIFTLCILMLLKVKLYSEWNE